MAGLRKLLGIFPNTEHYESKRNEIYEQYLRLSDVEKSENYKRYLELDAYIQSDEFISKKKELLAVKYKNSPEYLTEKSYIKLAKRKDIKTYLNVEISEDLKLYEKVVKGDDLVKHKELKDFLASEAYSSVKKYHSQSGKKKFAQSDLAKTLQQFEERDKSPAIKAYKKFINHKLYDNFIQIEKSEKLTRFEKLKEEVNSSEFATQKSAMKKAEFKESDLFSKLTEYKSLLKDRELKNYFKLLKSSNYNHYKTLLDSDELAAYEDLKGFIESNDYASQKQKIESSRFEDTPEYKKQTDFEQLDKKQDIVHYFKWGKSKEFQVFNKLKDSDDIKQYDKLKKEVESDEFIARKTFLTMNAKQRYSESEEHKLEQEYNEILQREEIQFYLKNIKSKRYDWYRQWKPVFEDKFERQVLESEKWLTKYYWGEKLLNDSYSDEEEYQYITDGKNLEVSQNTLKIITKKEEVKGKAWHPEFGFIPREYEYTSGLINSGDSFYQKYGAIEVKVKLTGNKNILEAVWMASKDKNLPHIDLVLANSKTHLGYMYGESGEALPNKFYKKYSRGKFASKFYIFSIEWKENQLVWKINGDVVATKVGEVPDKEMYLLLSTHLYHHAKEEQLPSSFEIDWVKCYQHTDYLNSDSTKSK